MQQSRIAQILMQINHNLTTRPRVAIMQEVARLVNRQVSEMREADLLIHPTMDLIRELIYNNV